MNIIKKVCSCMIFCLLANMFIPAFANPITKDSAQIKAEQFFLYNGKAGVRQLTKTNTKQKLICVRASRSSESEDATYYIFSRQGKPGFAIIAGDDCLPALIGYSLENNIDVENMPEALKLMLDDYDLYVKYLRKNGRASTRSDVGPLEPGTPIVGPYIQSTWNQGTPYNWLTPVDRETGNHTPTGCVPTAAAQILNYYKWPQNSFYRVYNWNDMLNSYGSGYSEAEGMAVATLMRDLGAIMGTTYATGGSSTYSTAYAKIPGYICTKTEDLERGLAKGPLVLCTSGGIVHAVIVDGYESNGLYHINWGWGGSWDGYYNLNDIAIVYKNEVHASFYSEYTYLLEPDINNEKRISVPAALGGLSINKHTAAIGDNVTVSLHNIKLISGNEFDGYLALFIYRDPQESFYNAGSYYGPQVYGAITSKSTGFEGSTPWNSSLEGKDFNVSITSLPELASNGKYVLVPVCFNTLETPEKKGEQGGNWRPLLQFADGTLSEEIPFEYQDGNYIFNEVPHGDFNIGLSNLLTASTYREKGKSSILAYINNDGSNIFTGTLTAKFVNTNDANDIRSIDYSLYLPANQSNRTILNTTFDFTGTYLLKDIEIWKILPAGNRETYLNKAINGTPFTILPYDSQVTTTDYYSRANIQISWKNDTAYVNDSIYKYEEANIEFYAYSLDADTAAIDVELWASPVNDGMPIFLKNKTYPLSKNVIRTNTIGGSTADMSLGDYRLIAFGRCGNNTTVLSQPEEIGKGYKNLTDIITDNIIHIFDPGIDIPRLKLNNFSQLGNMYYGAYDYAEAQIENVSNVDFHGYTSNLFYAGAYLSVSASPFRIRSGETATIYPRLYSYKDFTGTGEIEEYFRYRINNGSRDLTIPIDGDFKIKFTSEKPEKIITPSGIAFYYRNKPTEKPSVGFYSKGIVKRSLWKSGEQIMSFNDLETDSTYSTYQICPDGSELKDISAGNYILKVVLTDANGYVWPSVYYPLIIDEEDLPVAVERVSFDTNSNMSYDSEIPVLVTIKNPTNQDISTLVGTEINKEVDGEQGWWWVDSRELHPIYLPAMQQTTVRLNCHIISQGSELRSDGTFRVYVSACRTKRGSGHLDFGSTKGSDTIELPYVSDGILQSSYESYHIPVAYYTIDGKRVSMPPHGIYIVRYSDGSVKNASIIENGNRMHAVRFWA